MFLRRRTIASPDTRAFRRARIRTGVIRAVLVVGALALTGAAFASARGLEPRSNELVPGGKSGVVVLDVSLSIVNDDYAQARGVLERLIESDNPMGLVVFSDIAYELLPPRTPAKELESLLRFFTLDGEGRLPPNPWTRSFQGGTRISEGLALAKEMLERDGVSPGSIVLISDLETAPNDFTQLGQTLSLLEASPIAVRVVALSASSDGLAFIGGILGEDAFVDPVEPKVGELKPVEVSLRGDLPLVLVAASGLMLVALALYEAFAGGLALPAGAGSRRT